MRAKLTPEQQRWEDSLPRIAGLFPEDDDQPDFLSVLDRPSITPAYIAQKWSTGDLDAQMRIDTRLRNQRVALEAEQTTLPASY